MKRIGLVLLAGLSLLGSEVTAQTTGGVAGQVTPREEADALRQANGFEWRGDFDRAEQTLKALLEAKPTSTGGLFALERVTRARGRLSEVLPWADRYLEADPSASGVRSMKLRVLAEVDSTAELRPSADAWFRAEPGVVAPWREVARVWEDAFGAEAAIELLREGRETLSDSTALALEVGDLLARQGNPGAAVLEWSRAVDRPDLDLQALMRRIERLDGEPGQWATPLLDALSAEGVGIERRQAAVWVALDLRALDRAEEIARSVLDEVEGDRRARFLETLAGQADEAEAPQLRLWALTTQRADRGNVPDPRLDLQIAAAALIAGDTAQAVRAQARLAGSLPVGSGERRQVVADLIRVESTTAGASTLRTRLDGFRAEYPNASELDELTARVAGGLAARDDLQAAGEVLREDAQGRLPGPLSRLERGYLRLETAEGDEELWAGGISDLEAALPGLAPTRATEVIQLLTSLERTSPAGARALGSAEAAAHRGGAEEALSRVEATLPMVEPDDRPVLLSAAGRYAAEASDPVAAAMYLDALIGGFPDAPERPEAMLRLARIRASTAEGREDARQLLEELILEAPQGSIVPAARRELQRIRGMGE